MTETEWLTSDSPFDMLRHLEGKVDDEAFMRFSTACCRRIWPLITDTRSRAVVEATDAFLDGRVTAELVQPILDDWDRAYQTGEVHDLAGNNTHQAVESVCGVGYGHAAQVAMACLDSAGYTASEALRGAGAPQSEVTGAWMDTERAERLAQCALLRVIFGYLPQATQS